MRPPHPSTAQDALADLRRTERRMIAIARYALWAAFAAFVAGVGIGAMLATMPGGTP